MLSRTPRHAHQQGFTLVELAIVLVIIGLIVGGVLVGQDLIKSAEIRATISQIEKYNAAATTFRDKFGGLPGDLTEARAAQFGIEPSGAGERTTTVGEGNGDGVISGTATNPSALIGETFAFWSDLSQADLIPDSVVAPAAMTTVGAVATQPVTRMRESAVFHTFSDAGRNYFYIGSFSAVTAVTGAVTPSNAISPFQAFTVDQKLDNGDGDEGTVIAVDTIEPIAEATNVGATATDCLSTAAGVYNTLEANANNLNCRIVVRSSF